MKNKIFNLHKLLALIPLLLVVSCAPSRYLPSEIADTPTSDLAKIVGRTGTRNYPIMYLDGSSFPNDSIWASPNVFITAGEHEVTYRYSYEKEVYGTWTETEGVRCPGCSVTVKKRTGNRMVGQMGLGKCKLVFEAGEKYGPDRLVKMLNAAGCPIHR